MNNLINSSITKWAYASAAKHFQAIAQAEGIPYYVEGDIRNTFNLPEFVEFRMTGPTVEIPAKGERYEFFDINILASITKGRNVYRSQEVVGSLCAGFTLTIPVYKLGDESQDDRSRIGCLKLRRELNQYIDVNQFGIIRPDTNIVQHSVEGHYRLVLDLVFYSTSFVASANVTADLTVT